MKRMTLLIVISAIVITLATGSGALYQKTVDVGSGSVIGNVEEPVDPGYTGTNFQKTLEASQDLIQDVQDKGYKEVFGNNWASNDIFRTELLSRLGITDGNFLADDTGVPDTAVYRTDEITNYYGTTPFYIQVYFAKSNNKNKVYPIVYLTTSQSVNGGTKWKAFFTYDVSSGQWYESLAIGNQWNPVPQGTLITGYDNAQLSKFESDLQDTSVWALCE